MKRLVLALLFALAVTTARAQKSSDSQTQTDGGGMVFGNYGGATTNGISEGGLYFGYYGTTTVKRPWLPQGGILLEMGGRQSNINNPEFTFSVDYTTTYSLRPDPVAQKHPIFVFANAGYSYFTETGKGINYGGGVIWHYKRTQYGFQGLRLEYRNTVIVNEASIGSFRLSHEWGGGGGEE